MKELRDFCALLPLLLASCGGGGGGAASGPDSSSPPTRLPEFEDAISGYAVEASPTATRDCDTCEWEWRIAASGPESLSGAADQRNLNIDGVMNLSSDYFQGFSGDFNLFSYEYVFDSIDYYYGSILTGRLVWIDTVDARVLKAGEGANFDYTSYAYWEVSKILESYEGCCSLVERSAPSLIETGYASFGIMPGDIPLNGGATYSGLWDGYLFSGAVDASISDDRAYMSGLVSLNANFNDKSISGDLTVDQSSILREAGLAEFSIERIDIAGDFSSGSIAGVASADLTYDGAPVALAGDVSGQFYGPSAAEVGGVFNIGADDGTLNMMGGFAAKQ